MELGKQITHPDKSHRKSVKLPKESCELAEFIGIMLGDGGINNDWQANITLNSEADAVYAKYVIRLCKELFGVPPAVRTRKDRKALVISLASTTVVNFLVEKGLVRGSKIKGAATIPEWILSNRAYKKHCVRGLMDTDGCLYIHDHVVLQKRYRNIGLCFSSHAAGILGGFATIFEEFGVIPHITNKGRCVYLYQADAVAKYLEIFGTSNPRIQSVHNKWKRGRVVDGARLESV